MNRGYYLIGLLLMAATLLITAITYPHLPGLVPRHWNFQGQVDGYSPKWTLFLMGPGFMAGTLLLFRFLPWLSPRRFEVESFRATYNQIMLMMVSLMAGLQVIVLWVAMGRRIDPGRTVLGLVCLMFTLMGNVLGKVRRNFYIGVRTPWTLANDRVWNATHRLAAKMFVLFGIVGLILSAVGVDNRFTFAAVLAAALIPAAYSLVFYKRLERAGQL
jgi:uncharacterized membrane protein